MLVSDRPLHTSAPEPNLLIERAVLASIADGVVVHDIQGLVIVLNQAAARLLHVNARAALGRPVRELFASLSASGRGTLVDALDRLEADPYSYGLGDGITQTLFEIGMQVIQAHLSPVLTETGEFLGIVTVLRDITREVEADRARSEIISNVSHELRTPLTAIKGYSHLLLNGAAGELAAPQKQFLQIIDTNAERLTMLIADLLDISRIDNGRLELESAPLDLVEVLQEVYDMLLPECKRKHQLVTLSATPGTGKVLGDRNRLVQVVANLASNACRYTPERGAITLSLTRAPDCVRVDVADTGIGIAAEDQAKIFQRFYRADHPLVQDVAGTGLGLPIAKMLVEMHGGRLWVESEPGMGSTFTFVLPPAPDDADRNALPGGHQHRVLVVEDEPEIAAQIALKLGYEGLHVQTANTGAEALALARAEPFDLIALDVLLPDMQGMEVLQRLKADAHTASIPVIVVSVIQPPGRAGLAPEASSSFALERLVASVRGALGLCPDTRILH